MKTVKLIALDLDGTLIRENQVISAEDIAAIECAQQAGVPVVIATGRTFPTLEKILPRLHINTPVICCNGADVRVEGKTVYNQTMKNSWLRKAYFAIEKYRLQRYIFCGDHVYCEKGTVNEQLYFKWGNELVNNGMVVYCEDAESLLKTVGDGGLKMIAIAKDEISHEKIMQQACSFGYFDVVRGERLHYELTRKGANKAAALEFVSDMLGVDMQNVLAIGDSTNDLEMIRSAGIGVAMGNPMHELLAVADDVTLPIEQHGVAHAIQKYVFQNEPCCAAVVG